VSASCMQFTRSARVRETGTAERSVDATHCMIPKYSRRQRT
jgi:hypothetical protein